MVRQPLTVQKQMGELREQSQNLEGTSAILLQSGLDENWWADSMELYGRDRVRPYRVRPGRVRPVRVRPDRLRPGLKL